MGFTSGRTGITYGLPVPPRALGSVALWSAVRHRAGTATREIAIVLSAVLLAGLGAAQATTTPGAAAVAVRSVVVVADAPPSPLVTAGPPVRRADRRVNLSTPGRAVPGVVPKAPAGPKRALPTPPPPRARWLPSGTGMWLHDWRSSEAGHPRAVVARAKAAGLTHLYVQTGSTKKGWIGEEVLSNLMPSITGSGISVIAWDFPKLDDPEGDARRLARAATWHYDGVPMVRAVAPDVETGAEGTRVTPDRILRYYAALRAALPRDTPILATVPWPSEKRIRTYPYAVTAPWTDAFVPMAYWYNRSPAEVTHTSMTYLARYGKPVMPVGQGYDGRLDAPYLMADPTPDKSVDAFALMARRYGARSLSLWSWQTTGPLQWGVLAKQRAFFPTRPATPASAAARDGRAAAEKRAPGRQHRSRAGS